MPIRPRPQSAPARNHSNLGISGQIRAGIGLPNRLAGLLGMCLILLALAGGPASQVRADESDTRLSVPRPVVVQPETEEGDEEPPPINEPPDRVVDFLHMLLEIRIDDMNNPTFDAVETLRVRPIAGSVHQITLDAHLLEIQSVESDGRHVSYDYDGRHLTIAFDPPLLQEGRDAEIVIRYSVVDPPSGLIWTPESPAWPGRPAQIHSQGEPETNSYWFPCHDFPNERLTTELIVTVPAGYLVSSNGRLLSRDRGVHAVSGPDSGRSLAGYETFHWLQDKPHVNYLVSLVVGKFDVVDVGTKDLSMPVYVPPGRGADARATYAHTPEMIDLFEQLLDEPYPWDRYAQVLVWNFMSGGMENTSATTMYGTAVLSPDAMSDHDPDGLIAHELAHQWFGDLLTCDTWADIWLNEVFATYMTALWFENRDGPDAYLASIRRNFDSVIERDHAKAPVQVPMVSNRYEHPWDVFRKAANPYPKGASVLHMLRQRFGDDLFFSALGQYIDRFKFQTVETRDLRLVFEDVTGASLEQFFDQWTRRPGVPRLDVTTRWDESAGRVRFEIDQTQNIDEYNPAFVFTLPVWIQDASGQVRRIRVDCDSVTTRAGVDLPAEPVIVAVDPDLDVLAEVSVARPIAQTMAQALAGPTVASRILAARALGETSFPPASDLLLKIAEDPGLVDDLRTEAIESLQKQPAPGQLVALLRDSIDDPDVRRAAIVSFGTLFEDGLPEGVVLEPSLIEDLLLGYATSDSSIRVRAAAIRAIGKAGLTDHLDLLLGATETDSQHDILRREAVRGLVDMDVPEGLDAAIRLSGDGYLSRTRAAAIGAIADLGEHDPERAYQTLAALMREPERRAWQAAGEALVQLEDERALDLFDQVAEALRDPADREVVQDWKDDLEEALAETDEEDDGDDAEAD